MCAPVPRSAAYVIALLALVQGACWRTRRDVQRDYARTQQPASLAPKAPAARVVRSLPIRVHVDEDYRAEILRWGARIEAQLERANRMLEAQFGVRLVVKELLPWPRSGRTRNLASALEDLAAADEGSDVEWVVGFVSSSEVFSGSMEQLGMARPFGRHLVVRGMVSSGEGERFRQSLDALPEREREDLLRERALHREAAVLLHEWAHTLGAFHERDPDSILSPLYAPSAAAFSPTSAKLVELGLARRASSSPGADAAWVAAYRAEVERARADAWDAATVDAALAMAAAVASAAEKVPRPSLSAAEDPAVATARPGDAAILAEAEMNDRLGDPRRAWTLVEPIAARLPGRGKLQAYACHLRRRAGRTVAGDVCRGSKPLPARAAALLFAEVLVEEGDRRRALETLLRVEAALDGARPRTAAKDWGELAEVLARIDACTAAERSAARAPEEWAARGAVSRCASTRRRAVLPAADARVEPEREPEYVEAVLRARAAAEAGRAAPARAGAMTIEAAFPGAPGGPLVRCLAEAQGGDAGAARAACLAADGAAPWASEPPHVLGLMAGDEGRWLEARAHLSRALERDETARDVWAHLATVHQKLGDTAALEALDRRHRLRFGTKLRPAW